MSKIPYLMTIPVLGILTVGQAIPELRGILPLGGDHIYQLGVVFGSAAVVDSGLATTVWGEIQKEWIGRPVLSEADIWSSDFRCSVIRPSRQPLPGRPAGRPCTYWVGKATQDWDSGSRGDGMNGTKVLTAKLLSLMFMAVLPSIAAAAEQPSKDQVQKLISRSTECMSPPLGKILVYDDPNAHKILEMYKTAGVIVMEKTDQSLISGSFGLKGPNGEVFDIRISPPLQQYFDEKTNCLRTGATASDQKIITWTTDIVKVHKR